MNAVILVIAAALMWFSPLVMMSARTAAEVFAQSVLPALFPMMALSRLMRAPKRWPMAQTVLFAFAAGSPAAAQRMHSLRPVWSAAGWQPMLCLTGVMSPMFFTGTLASWLQSAETGWMLLGAHWLSAGIAAGIWRVCAQNSGEPKEAAEEVRPDPLPAAIGKAAQALLGVCGAMMLFSIAAAMLRMLMTPAVQNKKAHALLWAALEIGSGAKEMVQSGCTLPALGAMCSFGGLSIWLQNLLFVGNDIRPAKLLRMRMLHGAVCYGLLSFLEKIQNLLIT